MNQSHIEHRAEAFARHHHENVGQLRKYTAEPYIVHPLAVAELVRTVPHTPAMIAAALCHDTVEDTEATIEDVTRALGDEVAQMVWMLTDVSTPHDGLREHRKAKDREHLKKASPQAKTIKLADLIDNTKSIVEYDPEFARVYLGEKALLLQVLAEGDPILWQMAFRQLVVGMAKVGMV